MRRALLALLCAGIHLPAQPPAGPAGSPNPLRPGIADPNRKSQANLPPEPSTPTIRWVAAPAGAAAGAPYKDLKYPPLRPLEIPRVDSATLSNGMRLDLLEDHELPVVNGTALVHTGTLLDPAGKAGLAALTATVMRTGGAGSANGDQLNRRLEDLAGTVETAVGSSSLSVTFTSLKESAGAVLAILKDMLTEPQFGEPQIDDARTDLRNAIAHRNDDGARIAHREFSDILYGRNTPFGREQDYATIGNILRSDLQAFHARYFFPKNVQIAIRGDFDSAAMRASIERLFAGWTVEQPPPEFPRFQPGASPEVAGIHLAARKGLAQTYFSLGQIGGLLSDKDYAALTVLADILGGPPYNRLALRLHAVLNPATVTARWDARFDMPGLFEILGSSGPLSLVDTLKVIQEEVARIRSTEVTDEELKTAKEGALNSLVFAYDTKAKVLDRVLRYEYYGYPADFIDRYQNALESVSRADILRVAKERLKPESFAIVVVGDPGDFIPPIESLNLPVHTIDLTIPETKVTPVKSDTASLAKGKALLARMQQAVGGMEKLAAVKDSVLVADYVVDQNGRVTSIKHTEQWITPSHYREDNELGGGTISAYFDGEFGWITIPGGSVPLSGVTLKRVQGNLFRQFQLLLQGGSLPGTTANAVDDQTVEITGPAGQWVRVMLDPATGLPAKMRYDGVPRTGSPLLNEEFWSDFHDVGGLKIPFKIAITEGGRRYADVTILEYRINSGLKVSDLDKRP